MNDGAEDYFLSESSDDDLESFLFNDGKGKRKEFFPPTHARLTRSNSTSTVKVENTMALPNHMAIITAIAECLREVISKATPMKHASLGDARLGEFDEPCYLEHESLLVSSDYSSSEEEEKKEEQMTRRPGTFIRRDSDKENYNAENLHPGKTSKKGGPRYPTNSRLPPPPAVVPSANTIRDYLANMFFTAKCSEECHVISLIYIRRLIKCTESPFAFNAYNWKPIMMMAILMASKVWDDLSMVNDDFSIFMPYTLKEINRWELKFLWRLKYDVMVNASEYAETYFEMRDRAHALGYESVPQALCDMKKAERLKLLTSVVEGRMKEMRRQHGEERTESSSGSSAAVVGSSAAMKDTPIKGRMRRSNSDAMSSRAASPKTRFVIE